MILELIYLILAFFAVFFISQITHELTHYWLSKIKGGNPKIEIWYWHGIPSMHCSNGDSKLFYFAGVFNAVPYFLLGIIFHLFWLLGSIVFITNGFIQLFYGIYEGIFIGKLSTDNYMKIHYIVYLCAAVFSIIILYKDIGLYLGI